MLAVSEMFVEGGHWTSGAVSTDNSPPPCKHARFLAKAPDRQECSMTSEHTA
jgi:hypothetical protein